MVIFSKSRFVFFHELGGCDLPENQPAALDDPPR